MVLVMKVIILFNYQGEYAHGVKEGTGLLELAGGDIIQGKFVNGLLEGEGIQYQYADGKTFFGDYIANRKHGNGVFMYEDGTRFEGNYEFDLRHGQGALMFSDERSLKGNWKAGVKEGKFEYFDGKETKEVLFEGDVLKSTGVVINGSEK